ncbi:MAG: peptidylprolyl isomerase [Dysgonamonadaceae bacterium]|jgi:peptidyl-prolyl cis-trans isomerase SurA|nr:peptidylprolyl isomerase [Dysgonamonadaceae bacterium]
MRRIYLLVLFAFAIQISFNQLFAQNNIVDEVIWVVGDEAIFKSDVENARLQMQMEDEHLSGDPYCVIPEQMAIQKLYLHQAKLDSITVNESQVMQYVDRWINNLIERIGSKEKVEEYFGTIAELREKNREQVRDNQIVLQVRNKLIGTVTVTPSDVRQYYNRIPQDSLPFISTTVETQIITMEPQIALSQIDEVKAKLRELSDRVSSGDAQFSALARVWSQDKATANKGGELGFTGKGSLVPEFAAAAFELNDPNKVSRIVETEYGFHIIQLIEKRGDRINVRHILMKPEATIEEMSAASMKLDSIRNDILAGKFSFEEAAPYVSSDKDTRNNNGLMVNSNNESHSGRTGTSQFEMGELPGDVAKVVDKMAVGEISKPFTFINSKGREVVAVVKLKSRTPGHKANIADDYQSLKMMVENQKSEEILNKWLTKKIKETYIRIDPAWQNCDFQLSGWVKRD